MKSKLDGARVQVVAMAEKYPDKTLSKYCEYWGETYNI